MPNLKVLAINFTQVYGDISVFANLTKLVYIDLTQTGYAQITGDIGVFENHNLEKFNAFRSQLYGDIGKCFKSSSNVWEIRLQDTQISGSVNSLANKTKLRNLYVNNTNVSGDASSLNNLPNLTTFNYANSKVTGTWD